MKIPRIILIIFVSVLSAGSATGQNFTLSDEGLMALDWYEDDFLTATIVDRRDVSGPGVEFDIHFPSNDYPHNSVYYVSSAEGGAGWFAGIDVSSYDNFQLKYTLLSVDGVVPPPEARLYLVVGALVGCYEGPGYAYHPEVIGFAPDRSTTAVSTTRLYGDRIYQIGIHAHLWHVINWNPFGSVATLLVEPGPDAVPIRRKPAIIYVDLDAIGSNNGSSWADAFNDLQDALAVALPGDEIRVAQGAYSPEGPLLDIRQASNPNPANGATSVSRTADLSWTAGSYATSHDVYFGTTSPPPFAYNQTATTFDPGTMAYYTKYYWRIDEVSNGGKTTGTIWSFTTLSSPPPPPLGGSNVEESVEPAVDRTATFQLKNGVVIRGGYAGFGEPDPNERDPNIYETILSGDIGYLGDNSDNSYHVVTGSDCNESTVLDGFTITAGYANGSSWPADTGGGMYNDNGYPTVTNCIFSGNWADWDGGGMYNNQGSPTVTNCIFSGNWADWYGGGMYNNQGSPTVTNCTFSGNSAGEWGGGMFNVGEDSPTLTNCTFIGNSANISGGMCNFFDSSPTVTNCTFIGNAAERFGGGMYNYDYSSPTVTNCTFSGNSAGEFGGGMVNWEGSPTVTNCTFSGNSSVLGGGMLNVLESSPTLANCILWGNTAPQIHNYDGTSSATVSYSDVQEGWPGEGNMDADPCFVDVGYWDANGVWIDGDYHLRQTSTCINAADNNSLPADTQDLDSDGNTIEPIPFDIEGNPRIFYDIVDMGAYEFVNTPPIADAGPNQVIECACNTEEGTKVTLDGTNSSDPDYGVLTYTWTGPFLESPVEGAAPTVTLDGGCLGEYVITLVVNDGIDDSEPNEVMIRVVDTTPPEFEFSVSPTMLWPPNHKMAEITPSWTVSDECDSSPDVSLISIKMNEGDDTVGDGHTTNDIQIGEDGSIYLRAERSGTSTGRIYTITYQAVDDCGNVTVRSAAVSIPHEFKLLARMGERWLWRNHTGNLPEDLNGDGIVNLKDIAIFANNWIQ